MRALAIRHSVRRGQLIALPLALYAASRLVVVATMGVVSRLGGKSVGQQLMDWDARWYVQIAAHGYVSYLPHVYGAGAQTNLGFFPLLPLCIRVVHVLTGLGFSASGELLCFFTGASASLALWAMVREATSDEAAVRAVALLVFSPAAMVLSMVYTEGLAITLGASALWALHRRRWITAGVLAAFASACDPVACAIIVPCVAAAVVDWRSKHEWQAWTAPLLAPLGVVSFFSYLWVHAGTPFAWLDAQRIGWQGGPYGTGVLYSMYRFLTHGFADVNSAAKAIVSLLVAGLAVMWWQRRRDIATTWTVQGLAVVIFGALSPIVSISPRLVMRGFSLFAATSVIVRPRVFQVLFVASTVAMVLLTALASTNAWTP